MDTISLLLPSRGRPQELRRLFDSAAQTADHPDKLEAVVYLDDDDPTWGDYMKIGDGIRWTTITGPRQHEGKVNLSVMWNQCWAAAKGDVFMHCGDDIVFRTKSWDTDVRRAINERPGKIAFVWCDDGSPSGNNSHFGTHGFVHRNWTDIIGRFVPPYFVSDYNDTWFNDVSEMINAKTYLKDHLTEHMHFAWGKATQDRNTQERLLRHARENPEALYRTKKMDDERKLEAGKLNAFIQASK